MSVIAVTFAFGKYVAVGRHALRQRLQERALLLGRNLFLAMVLLIFSRLWQVLLSGKGDARPGDYVWYLVVAEWIALGQPALYLEIERDVRMGDLAYHLTRPISYLALKLSGAFAEMMLSMSLLAITGLGMGFVLAGSLPSEPSGLLLAIPLGLLSGCLLLVWSSMIGLSAFWLQDCAPLYWMWQKLLFVLGGLFVPLALYPAWLRACAHVSPFSAMLNGPARLVFRADGGDALAVAVRLLLWLCISVAGLLVLYRRALRNVELNGG